MAAVKSWFRSATDRRAGSRKLVGIAGAVSVAVCLAGATVTRAEAADASTATVEAPLDTGRSAVERADAERLSAKLEGMGRYAARFNQAIAGSRGQILEQSTGYMLLDRPRFKWVVDDPYPQIIVTEGELLKVYDPDLEQLTIRPLAEALNDTPVSLLTTENVALGDEFLVMRTSDRDGTGETAEKSPGSEKQESFIVAPRGGDSLFAEIRLVFDGPLLASLGILDHLGQYTEIRFEADPDRVIQSSDFELEVPPETDVIGG